MREGSCHFACWSWLVQVDETRVSIVAYAAHNMSEEGEDEIWSWSCLLKIRTSKKKRSFRSSSLFYHLVFPTYVEFGPSHLNLNCIDRRFRT